MLGTLDAIEEIGRAGEMKLVFRNGNPKAVEAVVAGRSRGTWDMVLPILALRRGT